MHPTLFSFLLIVLLLLGLHSSCTAKDVNPSHRGQQQQHRQQQQQQQQQQEPCIFCDATYSSIRNNFVSSSGALGISSSSSSSVSRNVNISRILDNPRIEAAEQVACIGWEWIASTLTITNNDNNHNATSAEIYNNNQCLLLRSMAIQFCGCPTTTMVTTASTTSTSTSSTTSTSTSTSTSTCGPLCTAQNQHANHSQVIHIVPMITCNDMEGLPAVDGDQTCHFLETVVAPICCIHDDDATTTTTTTTTTISSSPPPTSPTCIFCDYTYHYDTENYYQNIMFQDILCMDWDWFASYATHEECILLRVAAVTVCGCPVFFPTTTNEPLLPAADVSSSSSSSSLYATELATLQNDPYCHQVTCPYPHFVVNTTKHVPFLSTAPHLTCGDVFSFYIPIDGMETCNYYHSQLIPLCCIPAPMPVHEEDEEERVDENDTNNEWILLPTVNNVTTTTTSNNNEEDNLFLPPMNPTFVSRPWLGTCTFCDEYEETSSSTSSTTNMRRKNNETVSTTTTTLMLGNITCRNWDWWFAGFATKEECIILRAGAVKHCSCRGSTPTSQQQQPTTTTTCPNVCVEQGQIINATKSIQLVKYAPDLTCQEVLSYPPVDGNVTCHFFRTVVAPICCVPPTDPLSLITTTTPTTTTITNQTTLAPTTTTTTTMIDEETTTTPTPSSNKNDEDPTTSVSVSSASMWLSTTGYDSYYGYDTGILLLLTVRMFF